MTDINRRRHSPARTHARDDHASVGPVGLHHSVRRHAGADHHLDGEEGRIAVISSIAKQAILLNVIVFLLIMVGVVLFFTIILIPAVIIGWVRARPGRHLPADRRRDQSQRRHVLLLPGRRHRAGQRFDRAVPDLSHDDHGRHGSVRAKSHSPRRTRRPRRSAWKDLSAVSPTSSAADRQESRRRRRASLDE